jgi:hypothetical protein
LQIVQHLLCMHVLLFLQSHLSIDQLAMFVTRYNQTIKIQAVLLRPTKFLYIPTSTPFLPPIAASTIAKIVVGTNANFNPRIYTCRITGDICNHTTANTNNKSFSIRFHNFISCVIIRSTVDCCLCSSPALTTIVLQPSKCCCCSLKTFSSVMMIAFSFVTNCST